MLFDEHKFVCISFCVLKFRKVLFVVIEHFLASFISFGFGFSVMLRAGPDWSIPVRSSPGSGN